MAALEAFAAGGGNNFTAAAAELHEQFKKVFVGLLSEGGFLYCDRCFFIVLNTSEQRRQGLSIDRSGGNDRLLVRFEKHTQIGLKKKL